MRRYDRDEPENYDEYEDEEDQYEEEGEGKGEEYEEEEYEEEEERKPTKEELDYLQLRQRLKESFRKNRKEGGPIGSNSQEKKKKLPYDNYGSFFGPSQPVIAQRVIQESKSFLENPNLALRLSNHQGNKRTTVSTMTGSKSGVHKQPRAISEVKRKVETIKHARDYSFLLSDEAELPAPARESAPQSVSARSSEARPAKVPPKSKPTLGNNGRNSHGDHYERKVPSSNGQMNPKSGSHKLSSDYKPSQTSASSRKHPGGNNGIGPGRPLGPKALPSKAPVATLVKKASTTVSRDSLPGSHKPPLFSKVQSAVTKKPLELKKVSQDPNKGKVMSKQLAAPLKPHVNKPSKPISTPVAANDHRPKKKPARRFSDDEDDPEMALSMIRKMFNTNRFAGRDDNDSDMEANFDDIMKEEKRSAKIARREDEEQLRLIEEEERRERMRRKAKQRQLMGQ